MSVKRLANKLCFKVASYMLSYAYHEAYFQNKTPCADTSVK